MLVSGTVVGTFAGGTGGTDLVISWNANSSAASAQEVARQIAYRNTSSTPDASPRTVGFIISDGDGGVSAPAYQPGDLYQSADGHRAQQF